MPRMIAICCESQNSQVESQIELHYSVKSNQLQIESPKSSNRDLNPNHDWDLLVTAAKFLVISL